VVFRKFLHHGNVAIERIRRWVRRRLVLSDLLDVWIAVASLLIRYVLFNPQSFGIPDILVGTILIALVCRFVSSISRRRRRDGDYARCLYKLFQNMNEQVFTNDSRVRFTLFRPDPINTKRIIPWCRYRRGGEGPLRSADLSKMSLAEGVGIAGRGWQHAGQKNSHICLWYVPKHEDLQSLQDYYRDTWALNPTDTWRLSPYMLDVSWILAVGWTDAHHQLIGILCIDLQCDLVFDDAGTFGYHADHGFHEITSEDLRVHFNAMQQCLAGIEGAIR
jgi:hypothetical protein